MRVLAWVTEVGWEAVVDAVADLRDPRVTLLHVAAEDVADAPRAAHVGLLGRRRAPELEARLAGLTGAAAEELLDAAAARLGRPAERIARSGRVEREVVDAARDADVLVMARSADKPGPRSIGHPARFVVDHAPCQVLLVWPSPRP